MSRIAILPLLLFATVATAAEDSHGHHVGLVTGATWNGAKRSGFVGIDYVYKFESGFALGGYFEDVRGGFDLQAFGLSFAKYFDNGWRFSLGPGLETKLKTDENLYLFRINGGYDWHFGQWSIGPVATVDFIENNTDSYYLGLNVGYGF